MSFPRVLVIGNNCFSKSGSNGRTLGNFFTGWDKNSLAQFYIHNEIPDSDVCDNYYRVTDSEALKAFLKNQKVGNIVQKNNKNNEKQKIKGKKIRRTAFSMLVRDLVWESNRWINNEFEKWLNKFNPEVIVFQAGDSKFMNDLAIKISKEKNIPIVIYNSESYYLKEKNYLEKSFFDFIVYPIFKRRYDKSFEKLMKKAKHSIYNSELLKFDYDKFFSNQSSVIMTSSNLDKKYIEKSEKIISKLKISYLGNLGLGRDTSLLEIAESLEKINPNLVLDVYGPIKDSIIMENFNKCKSLEYKGVIEYNKVIEVIKNSDLLIHTENFNDFYRWDLKYGFSTKIADSLSSGTCFFVYAPEEIASSQYLINNELACVVTKKSNLDEKLKNILENFELRKNFILNGLEIAKKNHNENLNKEKFKEIINLVRKN